MLHRIGPVLRRGSAQVSVQHATSRFWPALSAGLPVAALSSAANPAQGAKGKSLRRPRTPTGSTKQADLRRESPEDKAKRRAEQKQAKASKKLVEAERSLYLKVRAAGTLGEAMLLIQEHGKSGRAVKLAVLDLVLERVQTPDDFRVAKAAVKYFQRKKAVFSPGTTDLFIKAAVRTGCVTHVVAMAKDPLSNQILQNLEQRNWERIMVGLAEGGDLQRLKPVFWKWWEQGGHFKGARALALVRRTLREAGDADADKAEALLVPESWEPLSEEEAAWDRTQWLRHIKFEWASRQWTRQAATSPPELKSRLPPKPTAEDFADMEFPMIPQPEEEEPKGKGRVRPPEWSAVLRELAEAGHTAPLLEEFWAKKRGGPMGRMALDQKTRVLVWKTLVEAGALEEAERVKNLPEPTDSNWKKRSDSFWGDRTEMLRKIHWQRAKRNWLKAREKFIKEGGTKEAFQTPAPRRTDFFEMEFPPAVGPQPGSAAIRDGSDVATDAGSESSVDAESGDEAEEFPGFEVADDAEKGDLPASGGGRTRHQ